MKLTIGEETYTTLTNLKFDPVADVTGSEVPINEFSVDVKTTDDIDAMQYAWLKDDLDNLWAKYWVVYADRMDETTVQIKAQSSLKLLERRMLVAQMMNAEPVEDVIEDIFYELGADSYILDESFEGKTVSGFAPYQSAKTRLQWVCFVLGAYIKSFFGEKIEILPVEQAPKLIPYGKTKWRPPLTYSEYRTRISVTAYSYEQGTPSTTDTWVKDDGGVVYIQSQLNHGLRNPDVPAGALTHESHITEVLFVNDDNVDEILTRLGPYFFKRQTVQADVINNAEYFPGDLVFFYIDAWHMGRGYIEKTDFSFGTQAVSRVNITPVEVVECDTLTVICKYNETVLKKLRYVYPIDWTYEIELPALDQKWASTRYIFVPTEKTITGAVEQGGSTVEVDYLIALGHQQDTLLILAADDFEYKDRTVNLT